MCSIFVFLKSCLVCGNVEKYGTNRLATDDNTMQHMRLAFWITKATNRH